MRNCQSTLFTLLLCLFLNGYAIDGEITIGAAQSNDYTSLSAFQTDLENSGVTGPLVVRIKGDLDLSAERLLLNGIATTSAKSITIESYDKNPQSVIFKASANSSSTNYLIQVYKTDYVTIRHLGFEPQGSSYNRAVTITGGSQHCTISNCSFVGSDSGSDGDNYSLVYSSNSANEDYLTVEYCTFDKGGWAINLKGVSANSPQKNNKVYGNKITNCAGAINTDKHQQLKIESNEVNNLSGNYNGKGIIIDADEAVSVLNNHVLTKGRQAFHITDHNYSFGSEYALIANNRFYSEGYHCFKFEQSNYLKIYHNTIICNGGNPNYAIYATDINNGDFKNNIVANVGGYYAVYVFSKGNTFNFNNNALKGSSYVGYYDNAPKNFSNWVSAVGANKSVSGLPTLSSNKEMKLSCGNNTSYQSDLSVAEVPNDFMGRARSQTPWMGANEFHADNFDADFSGFIVNGNDTLKDGKVVLYADTSSNQLFDKLEEVNIQSNGAYSFSDVPVHDYRILVVPNSSLFPNFLSSYHNGMISWKDAATYKPDGCNASVKNLNPRKIESFVFDGSISLSGHIYDSKVGKSTNPIPGLEVVLDKIPPGMTIAKTITDANGKYQFDNLPAGTYKVTIDFPGLKTDSLYTFATSGNQVNLGYCVDTTKQVDLCGMSVNVGTKELVEGIKLYPIPVTHELNLSYPSHFDGGEAVVFDTQGRAVLNQTLSGGKSLLGISGTSGMYYLRLVSPAGEVFTQTVLKR